MPFDAILHFWFEELSSQDWWKKSEKLDEEIKKRFLKVHEKTLLNETYSWRKTKEGRLAEIIILDQFSRNIFRDTPKAFQSDSQALSLCLQAVDHKDHLQWKNNQKAFLLMPIMHSESKVIQSSFVHLFKGLESTYDFALKHKAIVDRYGRYPHRNKILKRKSTPEELAFLKKPGSSF